MTLAVPTHLADTLGAATASGVEAAGHLLQDIGHAVNDAAVVTTGRCRKLARSVRGHRTSSSTGRNLLVLAALVALAAVVLTRRSKARPAKRPADPKDMNPQDVNSKDANPQTVGKAHASN